jgi:hypothetical protein
MKQFQNCSRYTRYRPVKVVENRNYRRDIHRVARRFLKKTRISETEEKEDEIIT